MNRIKSLPSKKSKALLEVVERERQEIARHLFEGPLQQLTDFVFALERYATDSQRSRQPEVQEVGRKLAELHRDSLAILQATRDCLEDVPLPAVDILDLRIALRQDIAFLCDRTGLDIQLDIRGDYRPCPPEQATALYRIMHEALVNVHKHAQARRAWVQLDFGETEVRMAIRDDGCGFDPAEGFRKKNHLGLKTMRERAHLAGGHLTVESRPGHGTSVQVSIPLPAAGADVPEKAAAPMNHLSKVLRSNCLLA